MKRQADTSFPQILKAAVTGDDRIARAFRGEASPDLPPAVREIVARMRERVEREAATFAAGAGFVGGPEAWQSAWQAALDRIFADAMNAILMAYDGGDLV